MKTKTAKTKKSATKSSEVSTVSSALPATAPASDVVVTIAAAVTEERKSGMTLFQITKNPETVTAEAYQWLMDKGTIPGLPESAPIRFLKWNTINEFSALRKCPLSLKEVQMLVQADGATEICLIDKKEFQPVRYVPFVPQDDRRVLEADCTKKLTELPLHYGGPFYQHPKLEDGRICAFSGHLYNARGEETIGSPLLMAAYKLAPLFTKKKNAVQWGESRGRIEGRLGRKQWEQDELKRRVNRFDEILAPARHHASGYRNQPFAKFELNGATTRQ